MKTLELTEPGDALRSYMHIEESTDTIHFTEVMPGEQVQQILDLNHDQRMAGPPSMVEGRHVARIPITTRTMWRKEWEQHYRHDMSWMTFVAKKFAHPDFSLLLTGAKRGGIVHRR